MKKLLIILFVISFNCQAQLEVTATFYYNPFLLPSIQPMYYPVMGSNAESRINVIAPNLFDLSKISFPGIEIKGEGNRVPVNFDVGNYSSYFVIMNASEDVGKATHNYLVGKMETDIMSGQISRGCSSVARITTDAAQKWLVGFCPVSETAPTFVACAIGTALKNAAIKKTTQIVMNKGCKVVVKYVSDQVIEISIETYKDLEKSVEEAKFWMGYLNSIDGMVWLMNRLQQ